jgi:hypothetical protein
VRAIVLLDSSSVADEELLAFSQGIHKEIIAGSLKRTQIAGVARSNSK